LIAASRASRKIKSSLGRFARQWRCSQETWAWPAWRAVPPAASSEESPAATVSDPAAASLTRTPPKPPSPRRPPPPPSTTSSPTTSPTPSPSQLTLILNQTGDNPALEAALQLILDARHQVAAAQTAVDQTNARLTNLRTDEERQRANIAALQNADKSSRERFVNDLNKTEDAIASAQSERATRTSALDAVKANLANRIESFQIDETI
jgi:hypothetical protein